MTILQVPRRFVRTEWGGTETVILETSRRLKAAGHEVRIICPNALADTERESIGGISVERVPYFYPYLGLSTEARAALDGKGGNMFSFSLLRRLKKTEPADVIHLHTGKRVGGIGRTAARSRGIPYVVTLHGGFLDVPLKEKDAWTAPAAGALEWGKVLGWWVGSRRVLQDAGALICVGAQEQKKMASQFPDKRVLYIPNGVDAGRFAGGDGDGFRRRRGIPSDRFVVLTVGRMDAQKNQRMAVDSMPGLLDRVPQAHLVLVGSVTSRDYYQALLDRVKALGVGSRVTVIPGLPPEGDELRGAYAAADVFALTSDHEPFGIVILEAWAAGLPVVASAVGGVPAFVSDGEDGVLISPGDQESLVRNLTTLAARPDLRRRLAYAGNRKARRDYSWERAASRLEGVYEDVRQDLGVNRPAPASAPGASSYTTAH